MALGDDLNRVDMSIESAVRKIERQFHDLNKGDQALTVDGVPVGRYLNFFSWDEAKHPHRRPLPEIVGIIQASVGKIEEELKQLSTRYSEKKQQLLQHQRKKGGNLMVANLNDILTPDIVSTSDFVNSEYLQTLVVVVPKNLEEAWLHEYHTIGDQIAEYGPKGNRGNVRGSPVVPGSSRKILEEGDSMLYTVTVLKGQYQPGRVDKEGGFEPGSVIDYVEDFKTRAREKRFIVRDFTFDPNSHASNEEAIAELEVEVDRLWSGLIRWCKAHFGETCIAWMHIKMTRVFVESVLRYGLPVNFVVVMYRPHHGKDKKLRAVLAKKYAHLQPSQFSGLEEGNAGSSAQAEYFPYVSNAFNPLTTT
jgi:V-type H+-transporting ATPase subunit C